MHRRRQRWRLKDFPLLGCLSVFCCVGGADGSIDGLRCTSSASGCLGQGDEGLAMLQHDALRRGSSRRAAAAQASLKEVASGKVRTVTLASFLVNGVLNARFTELAGEGYQVNGRETYWTMKHEYFLYYCPFSGFKRWQVTYHTELENARDKQICNWIAYGPETEEISNKSGWAEWDPALGQEVLNPRAGVQVVSTVSKLKKTIANQKAVQTTQRITECELQGIFHLVRGQPACNNCWAIAASAVVEMRLCQATSDLPAERRFVGPSAFVSAGYITSCAQPAFADGNGCLGGNALDALRWISDHGVPTGGGNVSETTCVPYFVSTLKRVSRAPPCPTSCTQPNYPRALEQDVIRPAGLNESWITTAPESALLAMKSGPILISFPVDSYFRDKYRGGIYEALSGEVLFYHVTLAFAAGPDYLVCLNSWGESWGETWKTPFKNVSLTGTFRISNKLIRDYTVPGPLVAQSALGSASVLPAWSRGTVRIDGFVHDLLNGDYVESNFLMFDHPTYVSGISPALAAKLEFNASKAVFQALQSVANRALVLYYCMYTRRWSVVEASNVGIIRESGVCESVAQGPQTGAAMTLSELGSLLSWSEFNKTVDSFVARPSAGIVQVIAPQPV